MNEWRVPKDLPIWFRKRQVAIGLKLGFSVKEMSAAINLKQGEVALLIMILADEEMHAKQAA